MKQSGPRNFRKEAEKTRINYLNRQATSLEGYRVISSIHRRLWGSVVGSENRNSDFSEVMMMKDKRKGTIFFFTPIQCDLFCLFIYLFLNPSRPCGNILLLNWCIRPLKPLLK